MLIYSCSAALPQNLHDVLVALGLGSDYDELALVIERRGVGLDHIVRQVTIGKLGLKCTDTKGCHELFVRNKAVHNIHNQALSLGWHIKHEAPEPITRAI